jgi:hypothetical protein
MKRLTLVFLLLGLVHGCSSSRVVTDHAREADFSKYETFQYVDTDYNIADTNDPSHKRIVAAIRREMAGAGLREVGNDPDVYVTYYGEDNDSISVNSSNFGYGLGSGWSWGGGAGSSAAAVRVFNMGTLVVDIWDAKEKLLVWRGVATSAIRSDPEESLQEIDSNLAEMFQRFPPDS